MFRKILHAKNYKRIFLILICFAVFTSIYLVHDTFFGPCILDPIELEKLQEHYRNIEANSHPIATDDPILTIDDVFISVKTTRKYHSTRLKTVIETWFQLARDHIFFFTDYEDETLQLLTNNHMVATTCSSGHDRHGLLCKMNWEYNFFMKTSKKYWCHFDDDQFVNIPRLVEVLKGYPPTQDWYLGKPSQTIKTHINSAVKCLENKLHKKAYEDGRKITFRFGTGGAGICTSRSLADKMKPLMTDGRFETIGSKMRYPDDVSYGFVSAHLLQINLTIVNSFHSHLEQMDKIDAKDFHAQVSLAQGYDEEDGWNVVEVPGRPLPNDPYRFYSLHCYLFPKFDFCHSVDHRGKPD